MKIYTNEKIKKIKDNREKVKKIIKYIFLPIIILILVCLLYIGYQRVILKKNSIELFGYRMYVVLTGSMKPEINPNDIVIVKKVTSPKQLNVGDVITFSLDSNSTITHRIIEIIEEENGIGYRTKGDNNNTEDLDVIHFSNIQGKLQYKISNIGVILSGGLTGTGAIIIVLILVLIYHHSSKMEDRALTREEARKKYNVYKYGKDGEDANDTI